MARIRTVKPEFFQHEELFKAEQKARLPLRLAYVGLWTQCDREGRFAWRPGRLKLNVLPWDDVDFEKILEALAEGGFIAKYTIDGNSYAYIPSWDKHQKVHSNEVESTIPLPPASTKGTSPCTDGGSPSTNGALASTKGASPSTTGASDGARKGKEGKGEMEGEGEGERTVPPLLKERDELFDAVCEVTGSDPKVSGSYVGKVCKLLRSADPPYMAVEVRKFAEIVRSWRGFTGLPSLGCLEKHIGQVRSKPKEAKNGTAQRRRPGQQYDPARHETGTGGGEDVAQPPGREAPRAAERTDQEIG
jgi:hypothetical protein